MSDIDDAAAAKSAAEGISIVDRLKAERAAMMAEAKAAERMAPALRIVSRARPEPKGPAPEKPINPDWLFVASEPVGARPEIALGARDSADLGKAARDAAEALVVCKVEIYSRADRLWQPVTTSVMHADRGNIEITRLVEMDAVALKAVLMREINFTRKTTEGPRNGADPRFEVPKLILADRPNWRFPEVAGVLAVPTIRPDGSLLRAEGYDPATQMLLKNLPPLPVIKASPSRAEAEEALSTLRELFKEFPFVDEASRAVALSLVITVLVRAALDRAPLHVIAAPSAGSGKSFLADIASMIATGRSAVAVAATTSADEMEKRIGAELIAGRQLVSLDNVNGPLISDLLCQSCTQDTLSLRPLGSSNVHEISNRAVVVANGINIQPADDLTRRTLFCRLDPGTEQPWLHRYSSDPLAMIAADRGKYVAAALTVTLGYLAAGEPAVQAGAVNSFARWARLVQRPLVWLGCADAASTMAVAREGDPKLQGRIAVLAAMAELFGLGQGQARTAAQIIETVSPKLGAILDATQVLESQRKALREALMAVAGVGKDINANKLGYFLRASRGAIAGGLRLCGEPDRTRAMHWWVDAADDAGEECR